MKRIALFTATVVAIVIAFVFIVFPWMRASAQAQLEDIQIRQPYLLVKQGETTANIMRCELLNLLASDPDCVENLLEINFSGVELSDEDLNSLSVMSNVTKINFYCCKNADSVLPACSKMPLTSIGFELTPFTPESVRLLGAIPTLASFQIEQNLDRDQVAALKLLPKNVRVLSSFPLDAYD